MNLPQKLFQLICVAIVALILNINICYAYEGYGSPNNLLERLDRIEHELTTVQKQLYRGSNTSAPMNESLATSMEVRIDNIEEQMRNLIGKLELLEHNITKISETHEKIQGDTEFRFKELEGKLTGPRQPDKFTEEKATTPPDTPKSLGVVGIKEIKQVEDELAEFKNLEEDVTTIEFNKAFSFVKANKYEQATKAFNQFIKNHPSSALVGEAYYWQGEIYSKQKNYEKAGVEFLQSYKKFPQGNKASESLLKLANNLSLLKKNTDACAIITRFNKEYPNSSKTLKSRAKELSIKLKCK